MLPYVLTNYIIPTICYTKLLYVTMNMGRKVPIPIIDTIVVIVIFIAKPNLYYK